MKRSYIIWIVIALAVVVGAIVWFNYQTQMTAYTYTPPALNNVPKTNQPAVNANQPAVNTNQPAVNANQPANVPAVNKPTIGGLKTLTLNTRTDAKLGTFLVAANGNTLYYFTKDTPNTSNCSGACAVAWPPYTVPTDASLAGGVGIDGVISTITRADGSLQATYNGKPLYFWNTDTEPGDTYGQGYNNVWFVVKP